MTFQQLHYILEIYRTGSITRAAENLFVTRPGVSLSLRNLEAELGYPIFVRTQNGLTPSPQGERVLEYASRICETQRLITNIGHDKRSRIEIVASRYAPVLNATVRLLEEYRDRKDISFTFKESTTDTYQKLAFFELEAVVTTRFENNNQRFEDQLVRRSLAWKELRRIPVVIVIGPGHRLYGKKDLCPRDFDDELLLETPTRALSKCSFLNDHIRIDTQRAICTNQNDLRNELLKRGIVYSIRRMPSEDTIRRQGFRCIPLPGVYQRLIAVTNPLRPPAPEAQRFLDLVEEELAIYKDPTLTPEG